MWKPSKSYRTSKSFQDSYDWELIDIPSVEGSCPIFLSQQQTLSLCKAFLYRYDLETLEWEERETVEVYDENGI